MLDHILNVLYTLVVTFITGIVYYLPAATGIAIIITLYMTYLYSGRIIFQRPSQIVFSTISAGPEPESNRDLIIIPLSVSYTGALSSNFQVALLLKLDGNTKFEYSEGKRGTFAILTNDFEAENINYSKLIKARRKTPETKFQDVSEFNYSTGFSLRSREKAFKICMFYPVNKELRYPISGNENKNITIYLAYRKRVPRRRKIEKLRNAKKCDNNISAELDSRFWGWKYGFEIKWRITNDILQRIRDGGILSVTRFEYHPFSFFLKSLRKIPTLLMCEDV